MLILGDARVGQQGWLVSNTKSGDKHNKFPEIAVLKMWNIFLEFLFYEKQKKDICCWVHGKQYMPIQMW